MNAAKLLNSVSHRFGIHVSQYRGDYPKFVDDRYRQIYEAVRDLTFLPWSGGLDAYRAVRYAASFVPGHIVECGVWRGGSSFIMAEALVDSGNVDKKLFLYDTFTGMTEPTQHDRKVGSKHMAAVQYKKLSRTDHCEWDYASYDEVVHNLKACSLPFERFVLVEGKVEDTIPAQAPDSISVLRLDTDWYESTRHELEHLFPRLQPGGVFISDDYGYWSGARKAIDEYFTQHGTRILLQQNAQYGAVVGVKL